MATDKNVPPMDSFESDNKAFQEDKRVEMKDGILNGAFNPTRGEHRIQNEQYETVKSNLA